jgi:hypothetical protein
MANVISFDVRVFDPDAPVLKHPDVGTPLIPGDPGYVSLSGANAIPIARGAYVDLNWGVGVTGTSSFFYDITPSGRIRPFNNVFPGSEDRNKDGTLGASEDLNANGLLDSFTAFQHSGMQVANTALLTASTGTNTSPVSTLRLPTIQSLNHVYDTWSTHYESNGIDDDSDGLIDEGADGMDQPTIDTDNNGVADREDGVPDDPAERETSPPYPVPLRGIEIRIRCIEPTTKEIRQITIRHAFDQS